MVGTSVRYACPLGFKLINGDGERTCLITGRWSGKAPTCQYVDCGKIPQGLFIALSL